MKIDILGIKVDGLTKREVLTKLMDLLNGDKSIFIVTPYSESIVAAQKDIEFCEILNSADISLPDGVGILWSAHYLKYGNLVGSLFSILFNQKKIRDPIPEKISGSDFIWDLGKLAADNNYSIFLLGGFDGTPDIVATKLKSRFPNVKIAGTLSPSPLRGEGMGEREIINIINNSKADFLFVALGPRRQEKWIYENRSKLHVKLAIGLGGTFDYIARKRLPAPRFLASSGLEWLWRLFTQPRRLWRIAKGITGLVYYSFIIQGK